MPLQLRRIPQYFRSKVPNAENWSALDPRDRRWEDAYRQRWAYDKVVRTTHGVNCTGSCSWKVYVKDGIVTWETQQTDYPTNGPGRPEYEPRGCPRGASYSWYIYSPLRVRYPYVRGRLWRLWQAALQENANDPVQAWASIVEDPKRSREYKAARGMGGFVRVSDADAYRLISAALLHTIRRYGPDRIVGFTPIPAMSMVSFSSGSRFLALLGGAMLSFYEWYADLPPASPQIWGEQTDVPESADWYNAGYLIMWGSNVPITRTPDAHFMVEARYRGTGVVAVSPDYTDNVKFADLWLPVRPGTDGALGMGMTHVVLKEFHADRRTEHFDRYVRAYTDLPFLVLLRPDGEAFLPDRYLRASDIGSTEPKAEWKCTVWDTVRGNVAVPPGSVGHRWDEGGRWNLDLGTGDGRIEPELTFLSATSESRPVRFPEFTSNGVGSFVRSVPVRSIAVRGENRFVTTVFDLLSAQVGVARGLAGDYPRHYDDPKPYTPAWQEARTGVDRKLCVRVAREFAQNASATGGRSMIIMGSGINQWLHTDMTYRSILNLLLLTGSQGVNGGGWAHYVGQEKVRPLEGWQTVSAALDWDRSPRLQNATSFFYFATDQWRYEQRPANELLAPWGKDRWKGREFADFNVLAARLGWLPSYPQFERNPIDLVRDARACGARTDDEVTRYVAEEVRARRLRFAIEEPDRPANFPRVFFMWRANVLSASGKGHEYFLRHLLGTQSSVGGDPGPKLRPQEVLGEEPAPTGKLDLLVTLDFRMSGSALYSDVVLPAASWYEKYDLSSTDMHPFVHPFTPAVDPVWESKPDWDAFRDLARVFTSMAREAIPAPLSDLVTIPLAHDTPDEIAQPLGEVRDWSRGETGPVPGITLPHLRVVERDYAHLYDRFVALGPLVRDLGFSVKGVQCDTAPEYAELASELGTVPDGVAGGCPRLEDAREVCEAILRLSGATNGRLAVRAWRSLEKRTGRSLRDLAEGRGEEVVRLSDLTVRPHRVITTPVWSGIESGGRQYSAFCLNVERKVPWRTLTGRQQFYVDHELFRAFGETLPAYRPPYDLEVFEPTDPGRPAADDGLTLTARWITPHSKWSFHTTFSDNLRLLTLFRGGPSVFVSRDDAAKIGIRDNDWIECFNRNGVAVARAIVTHRVPPGMVIMYHAQDRTVNVPGSVLSGHRGGLHNSVTRIQMKPTQMVGGYAQLSFAQNYWGPCGTQRDARVLIRKLSEVDWRE